MKANIIQKAEDIISEHDKKVKDFETACHAGICPVCGKILTLNHEVTKETITVGFISKKKKTKKNTWTTVVCPKGHELIHPGGWDATNPGFYVWDGCLNVEIDDYWKDNFDDDDFE